jgi:two-component system, OmpR family, response regulator
MAEGVQHPKILIVDDEPNIRELVQVALNFHGFGVCRRLRARANDVPIIFLTAREATSDAVTGLTIGGGGGRGGAGTLRVADLELDEDHWTVRRAGTQVELSPTEFRLLAYPMRHQGLMLTRRGVGCSLHLP